MMDKYHPGFFGKVGMRHFHLSKNKYHCPIINLDKLWSLVGEEVSAWAPRQAVAQAGGGGAGSGAGRARGGGGAGRRSAAAAPHPGRMAFDAHPDGGGGGPRPAAPALAPRGRRRRTQQTACTLGPAAPQRQGRALHGRGACVRAQPPAAHAAPQQRTRARAPRRLLALVQHPCAPPLLPTQARVSAAKDSSSAVVIDVTKYGIFKVLGKGELPAQPVVVKAKFFSALAEKKIKEVGGACVLVA